MGAGTIKAIHNKFIKPPAKPPSWDQMWMHLTLLNQMLVRLLCLSNLKMLTVSFVKLLSASNLKLLSLSNMKLTSLLNRKAPSLPNVLNFPNLNLLSLLKRKLLIHGKLLPTSSQSLRWN